MRIESILRRVLNSCREEIHVKRLAAVLMVTHGIVHGRRLSLTAIGRALGERGSAKHDIKRVDRLLSNWRMRSERWLYFSDMASLLIGDCPRPVILLDWTKVTDDFHALVAAVPIGGRAVTVYEEVHPERKLGNSRVQASFLRSLRDVLPRGCRPIIVTDAGFQGPLFRAVQELGWDFVGRVRGTAKMRPKAGGAWVTVPELYATATKEVRSLGAFRLYKKHEGVEAHLVLAAKPPRRKKHPWSSHSSAQGSVPQTTISGAKQPWLLVTSLSSDAADQVVAIYATRMQIEETFRDVKNPRFGWSLRHVRGYSADRLTRLLLLASLATLAVTLLGLAAASIEWHRRYQANTVKARTLSYFVLGQAIIQRRDFRGLPDLIRHGRQHARAALWALIPA
jgi:hypothetical protein